MSFVTDNFGFKQEERFDCGAKAGDVFAGQRRFPQQMYWDYKVGLNNTIRENYFFDKRLQHVSPLMPNDVIFSWSCSIEEIFWRCFNMALISFSFPQLNLIGERDEVPIHFCDKCGLPIHLYGRMVSVSLFLELLIWNQQKAGLDHVSLLGALVFCPPDSLQARLLL